MSQWASSYSYRECLDEFSRRFNQLKETDRVITSDLHANLHTINGYLFAICSAPAAVSPTDWLGELLPLVQLPDDEKAAAAVNLLISYQMHLKKRMVSQKYSLPESTDSLDGLKPASDLNSFSQGFSAGYDRISSIWSVKIPNELQKELTSQVFALSFFASTDNAKQFLKVKKSKLRPEQLADQVLANFPKAADLHVRLGMAVEVDTSSLH
ncbi:UPF0149 family protein [Reinekea sp.]|jgi:uncharacterized protein|uniref:UPF0149 family protein n=1 Tax=Reinekea sp. TaxID=1970455 RepID=UPI003988B97D